MTMDYEGGYWDEDEDEDDIDKKHTSMERAKDIMDLLEHDDELMSDFNFLLRQKKLKQLKK